MARTRQSLIADRRAEANATGAGTTPRAPTARRTVMTRYEPDSLPAANGARAPGGVDALTAARQSAIALLTDRFADDSLTVEDFEARLDRIYSARSSAELHAVMGDLAQPRPGQHEPARVPHSPPAEPGATPSQGGLVAILGSTQRAGRWVVPRLLDVQVVLGDAMIDLREALVPSGDCEISVLAALGGVKVLVPPGVIVEDNVSSVMGTVRNDAADDRQFDAGAVRVRLSGIAMMGEVNVRVALPGDPASRAWKRAKRRR